jgi:hypothetical protein
MARLTMPVLNVFAFLHAELAHPALDAFGVAEEAHQFVVESQIESGRSRVALTARPAAQLVVDPAGLVPLGSQDVKAASVFPRHHARVKEGIPEFFGLLHGARPRRAVEPFRGRERSPQDFSEGPARPTKRLRRGSTSRSLALEYAAPSTPILFKMSWSTGRGFLIIFSNS